MSTQYTNKTTTTRILAEENGIFMFPPGSYYTDTGSAPLDPPKYNIIIPNSLSTDFITNTGIQPYIKFELMSASLGAGNRLNRNVPWDFYIRFYTASHFAENFTYNFTGENDIGQMKSSAVEGYSIGSSSLYYTGSSPKSFYRDVRYEKGMSGLQLRDAIYNVLTGSTSLLVGHLSASKHQDATDPQNGSIAAYTCSIFYQTFRGISSDPFYHTGSLHPESSPLSQTKRDGSGSDSVQAPPRLVEASASMVLTIDPLDGLSFKMSVGTASLAHSGSQLVEKTILYVSGGVGGQGRVGFGTTNPKTKFDIKTDGFKVRSRDGVRELIFEEDGRLSAKKYSGTSASESIGGIIQLSYTPGTFENPVFAKEGETIGTINWVDESLNKLDAEFAFDDERQKYVTSASVAQITSTIKYASGEGVIGNLEFKVSPIPSGIAEYELKGKEGLISFMEINPLLPNAPVHFPYAISSSATVYANDLILDYDTLPTSDPSNKGQVYRNSSRQLFISAG
jgi:hypothetical protein|tara:strand:- start:2722 stop:4245 length:1524 start_codon:yes stop_codon:yes gene_type:complete